EIRKEATYVTSDVIAGLKGLPVGTSGKTLLMLSGGIDSPVAGYLMMKRGVEVEADHFHSPPFTSERAKQKVLDLAKRLTEYGMKMKVHIVPFTTLQQTIFREMPDSYSMTIMRRMMVRISEAICKKEGILSITNGESLGQVASQTMESMHAINEVTNYPIPRPVLRMDKADISELSPDLNTSPSSIRPYEDRCSSCVPKAPKTRPKREKVNGLNARYDFTQLIHEAVEQTEMIKITDQKAVEE